MKLKNNLMKFFAKYFVCKPNLWLVTFLFFAYGVANSFATTYSSSTVTQVTGTVAAGTSNQALLRISVTGGGGGSTFPICQMKFDMSNSIIPDNARLFYTGTSSTFATTTQLGATVANPNGTITFTFTQTHGAGTFYYWLAFDIPAGAPNCSSFDAFFTANGLTYSGAGGSCPGVSSATPTTPNPGGDRKIEGIGCWTYCTPVYTTGCGSSDFINKFVFNTLCNSGSGCTNTTATAYTNYSSGSFYTSVFQGATYTATISVGAGTGTHGAGIWIDFNNDGDFQDADEFTLISNAISPSTTVSADVMIPGAAVVGETRMRVRYIYAATPAVDQTYDCGSYGWGEAEDYTINICDIDPGYATASNYSPCTNGTTVLSLSSYSGTAFQWMVSSDLCTWSNVTGGSGATTDQYTTGTLADGTYYYICKVSAGCFSYSNIVTIAVSSAAVGGTATPTVGSVACAGSTTVTLAGSTGTIQWQISTDGGTTWSDITGATTSPLSTGALYGDSKYRAKLSGCTVDYSTIATVTVTGSGSTSWLTTAASTDWFTAGNWTSGVPNTCVDAIIQAGANQPIMAGAPGSCRNLTINASATLTVNSAAAGKLLSVYGSITNNGTFTHNSGGYNTLLYGKSSTLGGTGTWNGTSGPLLYLSAANYTLSNNMYAYYTTIDANSTLSLSSYTYVCQIASGFVQTGICNLNTGTLEIRGAGASYTSSKLNHNTGTYFTNYQTNSVSLNFNDDDFYNVKRSCTAGNTLTMAVSVKVGNNFEVAGGTFAGGAYTLTVGKNNIGLFGPTGDFINNATFTPSTGTVLMQGANTQLITGTSPSTFYKLTIDNSGGTSGGVTQVQAVTVTNTFALTNGKFNLNSLTATVTNAATSAITRSSGYVASETNLAVNPSILKWNIGATTGAHVFPFGTISGSYIPVTFNNSGDVGNISISTRPTTDACITPAGTAGYCNQPWAGISNVATVAEMWDATLNSDGSIPAVIDRWWDITSSLASPIPAVTLSLSYLGAENTLSPATDVLCIQHWNGSVWDNGNNGGTGSYTSTGTAGSTVAGPHTVTGTSTVTYFSPYILSRITATLPIELLSFTGECKGTKVLLNWVTASELNNNYYTIERSADGNSFESIGIVTGGGTSSTTLHYSYSDEELLPTGGYYRLKQTDYNGESKTSDIIYVEACVSSNDNINIFSQGGSNYTLIINTTLDDDFNLTIYSVLGQVVLSKNFFVSAGANKLSFNLENFDPSMFFVNVNNGKEKSFTKKIVLSHH